MTFISKIPGSVVVTRSMDHLFKTFQSGCGVTGQETAIVNVTNDVLIS